MSVPNPKENEKNSSLNFDRSLLENDEEEKMTRAQALAVAWTGLEVLALDKEMRILNDLSGALVLIISSAKVVVESSTEGKKRLKLVDLKAANTSQPAESSVGS